MSGQRESPARGTDTPSRRERLELYNGEFQHPVSPSTGFHDEIEPVDSTIESMAAAASIAHEDDDTSSAPQPTLNGSIAGSQADAEAVSNDGQSEDDLDKGLIVNANDMTADLTPAKKKRKSKNRKPASKRGQGKPTGFEENFADAPLTPEQANENKELYSPDIPFAERILTAIQRFERTRKLTPERRDIFYKYLAYGGVDVGPNMFQGRQDTANMDKDELTTVLAQTNISDDIKAGIVDAKIANSGQVPQPDGPSETLSAEHQALYAVDFLSTMKAFLSRRVPNVVALETWDRVNLVTTTLERFMDYLLQNEVCSEFGSEVLATRNLCRAAKTEVWNCAEAQRWLPGDFNIACSTLFGGKYGRDYDGETYWGELEPGQKIFVGLTVEKATQIVGFAIAGAASEEDYSRYHEIYSNQGGNFEIVETIRDHGFEITRIEKPTAECEELYRENTSEYRAVGRVYAKFWSNPDAPPEDIEPEIQPQAAITNQVEHKPTDTEYVFFIESSTIIPLLQPGQRVEATIHKLNCGVWFFDEVLRVFPSFDTWIENELMLGWKEPKPLKGSLEYEEEQKGSSEIGVLMEDQGDGTDTIEKNQGI